MAHAIEVLHSEPLQNLLALRLNHLPEVLLCIFALFHLSLEQLLEVMQPFQHRLVTSLLTRSVVQCLRHDFLFDLLVIVFQSLQG